MLWINTDQMRSVEEHAREGYPYEVCGLLLGTCETDSGVKPARRVRTVREVLRGKNLNKERAADRYNLDPADQIRAEKKARQQGWEVLGFYHSHPDHPCRASNTDFEKSWEGYSYLIVSVLEGEARERACWIRSAEDRNDYFVEEAIKIS